MPKVSRGKLTASAGWQDGYGFIWGSGHGYSRTPADDYDYDCGEGSGDSCGYGYAYDLCSDNGCSPDYGSGKGDGPGSGLGSGLGFGVGCSSIEFPIFEVLECLK